MSDPVREALPLLPCPFCGHDSPEFERMGTRRQSCIVACVNCGCRHESSDEGADCGKSWNTRAALAQPAEPVAGWRMVPVDPTDAMVDATHHGQPVADIYRDMIAAAPAAPQGE